MFQNLSMDSLAQSAPIFQLGFKEDVMIAVVDHEKFLEYVPSKSLNLGLKKGTPIPKDDISLQKALQGETFEARLPESVYGFHFYGKTIPITNANKEVIGAIGFGYNIHDQVMLEKAVDELEEVAKSIQGQANQLVAHSEELAATSEDMFENSEIAIENTKQINNVINVINTISKQTNLLGLNASIEASRAGAAGKGFTIVANEVRKLSMGSADAAKNVTEILNEVKGNIENINEGLSNISEAANSQALYSEENIKIVEQLFTINRNMKTYINKLK